MGRKAKPNDDGGVINITNAMKVVEVSVKRIVQLKEERKKITAQINSERGQCKAAGVPSAALDLAIRIKEMDPEQRAAHDEGYLIARKAIGLPVQQDLFETISSTSAATKAPEPEPEETITPAGAKAIAAARAHLKSVPAATDA